METSPEIVATVVGVVLSGILGWLGRTCSKILGIGLKIHTTIDALMARLDGHEVVLKDLKQNQDTLWARHNAATDECREQHTEHQKTFSDHGEKLGKHTGQIQGLEDKTTRLDHDVHPTRAVPRAPRKPHEEEHDG